jgi:transposase-like protein
VRVARSREPGVTLEKIAADFGIHPIILSTWLKRAEVDQQDQRPGTTLSQSADLREANKRIRLLEQEVEVLRRALAYVSQASLPGKCFTRS